jgi:hypothetical protein
VPHVSELLLGIETVEEQIDRLQSVSATGDRIAPANPDRIQLVIINPSGTDVTVDTRPSVEASQGFVVPKSNGTVTFSMTEDGTLTTREFHAVTPSGTVDVVTIGEEVDGQPDVMEGS